ncbi:MAG: dTDP-4-dehydrorhamnose 3,5-epimerase [Methanobacteriaceae archaeon]
MNSNNLKNPSKFKFIETKIKGVFIIEPTVFGDDRGYFMETYHKKDFVDGGIDVDFVQDNQSKSKKGVLRGLHFQHNKPQGKLVRVLKGEVFDVAVDLRNNSETYGQWVAITLSETNKKQFYVPEGFAHGFLVLSDEAEFAYKCTDFYDAADEGGISWDDKDIGIDWPLDKLGNIHISLSQKDENWNSFKESNIKF